MIRAKAKLFHLTKVKNARIPQTLLTRLSHWASLNS